MSSRRPCIILVAMTTSGPLTCVNCGAPDPGEVVTCRYCKQAVSAATAETAIPCPNPQCRTLCRWGKQRCPQCQAWIVVSCVFCGALSPHSVSACLQCNEAFVGAAQRKHMREMQHAQAHQAQQVGVWGNVAASFLGAAAGSVIGAAVDGDFDVGDDDGGDFSDDTDFDFSDE